jgi:hypothetical protein
MSSGMSGTGLFPDVGKVSRVTPERADRQRRSLPADPQRPESESERKQNWNESCRQETLRVAALAEENRKKREAEARQQAEAERHRVEAEQKQRELDQHREAHFKKLDEHNAMLTLAFAPYAPTANERQAVSERMDSIDQGLGSDEFSPEAWVIALLESRT